MNNIEVIKEDIKDITYTLDQAKKTLDKAANWGFLDIFGGKFLSSYVKHSHIDDAEELLDESKEKLSLLKLKLQNLDLEINSSLDIGINKFFDVFMDNIFSDIFTQSKISDAQAHILEVQNSLREIYEELNKKNED